MKISAVSHALRLLRLGFFVLALCVFATPAAHAGLTFELHIYRDNQGQHYAFFTPLYTNSTPPAAPLGTYFISSPFYSAQQPTNGSWRRIEVTTNSADTTDGLENGYSDFASVMRQITNGNWTILFTNATVTNVYNFTVSAPNMISNMLPATIITFPSNGALNVTNQPNFTWQGPTSWPVNGNAYVYNYDSSFFQYASLPAAQNNWTIPASIPNGVNCYFRLQYITNGTPPIFVATTPLNTNSSHQAISGWISTSVIETGDSISFAVTNPPVLTPVLIAHYTFDAGGNLGQDSSGNGYDLDYNGGNVTSSTNAEAGGGAAYFDGNSFFSYNSTPANVLSALAGDFTISFWINTTQDDGNEGGPAWAGAGIVAADIPGGYYDIIPAALDGGEIGFNTGPYDDTVNSAMDINDGNYHHVVITRNQTTGEKQIYIDGMLDYSDFATMNPLSDPRIVAIGCAIDASQSDPNNANPGQYFQGLLDDLQLYAGVLSSNQIAQLHDNPGSTAGGGGHKNVAHYTFDDSGNLGQDSSGNGNDMTGETYWGPQHEFDTDAVAGGGAIQFFGTDAINPDGQALTNLNAVLAGSFTFSAWVKTTVTNGADYNNAFFGAVIFWAYNDHSSTNDTIPLAITGSKAAFTTRGGDSGDSDTLHSFTSVNDGSYHLITVTRDAATGEKKIYVDGNFETSQTGTTNPLDGNNYYLTIGGRAYILESDSTVTNYSSYNGLLDDLQIYSGVLSADEVMQLYNNPGSVVPDTTRQDFNIALNTTGLNWSTGGDASWFIETTNTYDGNSAAQSGLITDSQSSYLQTTVSADGQVSFYWKVSSEDGYDYLTFYINGNEQDAISGEVDWNQEIYSVSAGDTLRWEYTKDGSDSEGLDAGFLDEVNYTATPPDTNTPPVITLNPFSQTNSPGYNVALLAGASGIPDPVLQWFKVGSGAISGATNALYIPTNSGNAGVAGSYYAVASNIVSSANTTTAAVTFVSAPLPPDWSVAFKSPFQAQNPTNVTKDFYYGAVLDVSNNIYTAAEFDGDMTVGSLNLESGPGGDAAAIVKQTSTGSPLWVAAITNKGNASALGECVAPAPGGGVYLLGNFNGANWLGTNQLTDAGSGDIFLARFDANGSNVWVKTFGGTNADFSVINSLAADPSGNVTLVGLLGTGPVTIGTSNYNVVAQEGILIQLDQTGAVRWSQLLPAEFPQYLTYSAGRLYVSLNSETSGGSTNVTIGGISNVTDRAWAVACLNNTDGNAVWLRGVGGKNGDNNGVSVIDDVPRLAVSGTNVFLTGVAYGNSAAFGPFTVNFNDSRGQYFARYDTNGNAQLATTYGSVTTTPIAAVADGNGNVYVSGDFDTYAFFGADMLAAPENRRPFPGTFSQAFLAKFDRNGNPLWARQAVSPATVNFLGIALAPDGVWASGYCISTNTSTGYTPTFFGSNFVYGDTQTIVSDGGGGFGTVTFTGFPGGVLAKITDSAAVGSPVTLLSPQSSGGNFQFQFLSQSGFTHSVLYRTNLVVGNWQTYSNVTGDGTLKTIPIPLSIFSPAKQGFVRVSTQ